MPLDTAPLLSILMGVYYRRLDTALLERSVSSILRQSIPRLELLICDDGSTEAARRLLDMLSAKDGRIRLVRPGGCISLPAKLNACLEQAQSAWIARMDDDDFSHPQRLERQLAYLRGNPRAAFAGCNVNLCREGKTFGTRVFPEYPAVQDFYFTQPFIHPALLFRREALEAVGGYSEEKHCILCEDYDLLLRLYKAGYTGANVQEILFDYTIPATARGNRDMRHRWNEAVTRYRRFKDLGVLPEAWTYVIKPLAVGLLPESILRRLKGTP